MEQRPLGTTGLNVSSLCLGTMTWGQQNTEQEAHAQLDFAWSKGINFLDTAELYPIPPKRETQGLTELYIGTWLKRRGKRDDVIIASKVCGRSQMDWFRQGGSLTELSRAQIFEAVDGSLKRLQTDHIDLYQLHWPDRAVSQFGANPVIFNGKSDDARIEHSLHSIFDVLGDVVKQGKARHVGLSNESAWGVMRSLGLHENSARGGGPPPPANGGTNQSNGANATPRVQSLQNAYSLLNRTNETNLAEIMLREKIAFLPYSPLAQGFLTGKYQNGAVPAGSRKSLADRLQRYETPGAPAAIDAYLDIARQFGLDPAQMALQFVNTRSFVTSNIIGATSLQQLATNIASVDLPWTAELEEAVNAVHLLHTNPCP